MAGELIVSTGAAKLPSDLRQEVATVQRDITTPFFGNYLLPRDETLTARGGIRSYWLYDDLERDGRVYSVMQKRKGSLKAYPWTLTPASDQPIDKQAAELVKRHLAGMNFNFGCEGLLDALLKGFAVAEIMWGVVDNEIRPLKLLARDQRRFRFGIDRVLRLLTWENLLEGDPVPDRKFVVHSFGAKDSNPYGYGLGSKLFWPVFFKRQDISFWLTFNDKYGSPTSVGKYPSGTTPEDQTKLLAALQAIAQDAGIAIPEGMTIEFLEATRSGTVDAYERMARYMDEQISEIVLGETLSTSVGDSGSRALGDVHNEVRLELSQGDGELLAESLNETLVRWIVELNMPAARAPTLSWEVSQGEDLAQRATRDKTIYDMGFEPSEEYIRETYGDGWVKRQVAAVPPGLAPPVVDPTGASFAEDPGQNAVDRFADRLGAEGSAPIGAMVDAVRALFAEAGSLEDVRDRLIELYPKLDAGDFAELMQRAVTASDLAGRYEAAGK